MQEFYVTFLPTSLCYGHVLALNTCESHMRHSGLSRLCIVHNLHSAGMRTGRRFGDSTCVPKDKIMFHSHLQSNYFFMRSNYGEFQRVFIFLKLALRLESSKRRHADGDWAFTAENFTCFIYMSRWDPMQNLWVEIKLGRNMLPNPQITPCDMSQFRSSRIVTHTTLSLK